MRSILPNEDGSAVILALSTLIALSSSLYLGGASQLTSVQSSSTYLATTGRTALVNQLLRAVEMPAFLRASIDPSLNGANPELQSCIIASPGSSCSASSSQPLQLYLPGSGTTPAVMTGTPNSPVFYTTQGIVCPLATTTSAQCPFAVSTQFKANCGGAATCNVANSISISFTVHTGQNLAVSTSGTATGIMPASDISMTGPAIDEDDILPPLPNAGANDNLTGGDVIGSDIPVISPVVSQALTACYVATSDTQAYATALQNVTDPNMVVALVEAGDGTPQAVAAAEAAVAGISDPVIADAMIGAGISNAIQAQITMAAIQGLPEDIAVGLIYGGVTDASEAQQIAQAVSGVSNPTTATALAAAIGSVGGVNSNTAALVSALSNTASPTSCGTNIWTTEQLFKSGITNATTLQALATLGVDDPTEIQYLTPLLNGITTLSSALQVANQLHTAYWASTNSTSTQSSGGSTNSNAGTGLPSCSSTETCGGMNF
jgi:hypothetical protein